MELAQFLGQVATNAMSLWVSAGSPALHDALAHLVLPPEFPPGLSQAPTNLPEPSKTPHSTEGPGKGGRGWKVQCCDGKASQHQDLKPTMALPGLGAAVLVFSQWRGSQMELEVLVLEDAAGGWVTVGDAEQPVLLTAVATGQLCQESQLQDKTQIHHPLHSNTCATRKP